MDQDTPQRYLRVAAALRDDITAGTYALGSEIPTVAALATEFDVSHMTVKRALAVLRSEGVIATRRGARSRVSALPSKEAKPLVERVNHLQSQFEGLDARVTALESHASKRISDKRT